MLRRSTLIVPGRLAMKEARLTAARGGRHGVQIMTFEQAATRLAGGFARPIDAESLREALQSVLSGTAMGELDGIKSLPGMVSAAADTLHKAWRAGIDLDARALEHPRLADIAKLEAAVLGALPAAMMRPCDIVAAATERLHHANAVLGSLQFIGHTELSPCWRSLVRALASTIPVTWVAGPRSVPAWIEGSAVVIESGAPRTPATSLLGAATTYHEAIEAMRWVRALLASGRAKPSEIAIAAASPADYDDHFLTLRGDANLDLHFVHGIRTLSTRDGQAAAALADILLRGLSQQRLRRLAALCADAAPFAGLPDGWLRVLPSDAPLSNPLAWNRFFARLGAQDWPDGQDHTPKLRALVDILAQGPEAAAEIGERFLAKQALAIWRKALVAGPAASIDRTLEALKQDDGREPNACVAWMSAEALAASPRRFVRLVGLNSSRWPRGIAEDRLLPDHIIPTQELDPLPVNLADRRDFETILATTADEVVLSRARRDSEGRLLGRSSLLARHGEETYLRRNVVPPHAFSETDRLMARTSEFAATPQARSAIACWTDWWLPEITRHDGLVRPDHPVIAKILADKQSASSLKGLLRNPLGYVWKYGLGLREPQTTVEPIVLEMNDFGTLVHLVLEYALRDLEHAGGIGAASHTEIAAAVLKTSDLVAADWESKRGVPPSLIWRRSLADARELATRALNFDNGELPGSSAYAEVAFGGALPKTDAAAPWDPASPVTIPGAQFEIKGYIDRIDIAGDGSQALVRDYKTGRTPSKPIRLKGGAELQRCLYAFAVKALLGSDVAISASLLYPKDMADFQLDDPEATLADLIDYLTAARASLTAGKAIPGPDTGGAYDDLAFALPANATATYCKRKGEAAHGLLADFAQIWEAE